VLRSMRYTVSAHADRQKLAGLRFCPIYVTIKIIHVFHNSQDEKYDGILDGMLTLFPFGENPKRFMKVICKMIIKGLSMKYVFVEKVVSMGGWLANFKTSYLVTFGPVED
jgi:hypothetical protein